MPTENKLQWVNRKIEEVSSGVSQQVDTTSASTLTGLDIEKIKRNLGYTENSLIADSLYKGEYININTAMTSSLWYCGTNDFEIFFDIEMVNNFGGIFFTTHIGGLSLRINAHDVFDVLKLTEDGFNFGSGTIPSGTFEVNKRYAINITRQGANWKLYVNGELASTYTHGSVWDLGNFDDVYSLGYYYAPLLYGGVHRYYRHHLYSIILTDDQRRDLVKGKNPYFSAFTRESKRDASTDAFSGYASNGNALPTISGNDISATVNTGDNLVRIRPFVGRHGIPKAGMQIKIKFTISEDVATVNTLNTVGSLTWSDQYVNTYTPAGTYERIHYVKQLNGNYTWNDIVFFFVVQDNSTHTFTISNLSVEILGCVTKYESDSLLKSGRWLDKSGNYNDLEPQSYIPIQTVDSNIESITRKIRVKRTSVNVGANYGHVWPSILEIGETNGIYGGTQALNSVLAGYGDVIQFCSDGSNTAAGVFPKGPAYMDPYPFLKYQELINKTGSPVDSGETYGYIVATLK